MNVVAFFVADTQPSEFEQPRKHALDNAAMFTQSTTSIGVPFGDERLDASCAQGTTDFPLGIVGTIRVGSTGTFASPSTRTLDRRNGIDQGNRLLGVVDICGRVDNGQRRSLTIAGNMPFRAIFAAIGGIGASLRPPKTARTEQLSKTALDQSISSASPNSSNSTRHTLFHTPASCQSRKRRQQVMPLPQRISWGRYSQGQPVRSTNKMPVSAARAGTGGRPPFGLRFGGGNSGSIRAHNSSVSSGLDISSSSLNTRKLP